MDFDIEIFNLIVGESIISAISFMFFVIKYLYYPWFISRFSHTIFGIVFWGSLFFFVYLLDLESDIDIEEREFVNSIRQINFELFNIASSHVPSDLFYHYIEDEYELDEDEEEGFDWTDMHEEFFEFYENDPFDEMIYWSLIFVPSGNDQEYGSAYMYPLPIVDTDSVYEQWNHDIEIDYNHPSGLTGGGELLENEHETDDYPEDDYRFTFVDSSNPEYKKINITFCFFSFKFSFSIQHLFENIFDFDDDVDFDKIVSELRFQRKKNWETLTGEKTYCGTSVSSNLLNNIYDGSIFYNGFDKSMKIDLLNANPGTDSGSVYSAIDLNDDAFIVSVFDHGTLLSAPGSDGPWIDMEGIDPEGYFLDAIEKSLYYWTEVLDIYPFDDWPMDFFDSEMGKFEDDSFESIYMNHHYNVPYYSRAEYQFYHGYDKIDMHFFPFNEKRMVSNSYDKYYLYYNHNPELMCMDDYGVRINFTNSIFYDRANVFEEFKFLIKAKKEDWIYLCSSEKSYKLSSTFDSCISFEFFEFYTIYEKYVDDTFRMQSDVFHFIKIPELIPFIPNDNRFSEINEKCEYVRLIPPVTVVNPEDTLSLDEFSGSFQCTFFNNTEHIFNKFKFTPYGFYSRDNRGKPVISQRFVTSDYIPLKYKYKKEYIDYVFGDFENVFQIEDANYWNEGIRNMWPEVSNFLLNSRNIINSYDVIQRKPGLEYLNVLNFNNIDDKSYMYWMAYQEILGSTAENFTHAFSDGLKDSIIDINNKRRFMNKYSEFYFAETDFINYYVLECRNREINSWFANETDYLYYEYCPPINHSDWFTSVQALF